MLKRRIIELGALNSQKAPQESVKRYHAIQNARKEQLERVLTERKSSLEKKGIILSEPVVSQIIGGWLFEIGYYGMVNHSDFHDSIRERMGPGVEFSSASGDKILIKLADSPRGSESFFAWRRGDGQILILLVILSALYGILCLVNPKRYDYFQWVVYK